jgi:hypothetical protein
MKVVGSILLELGETIMVARLACSDDARLLLVAYTDGTLSCLNVLIVDDDDGVGELAFGFTHRWKMMATAVKSKNVQFPTLEFLHEEGKVHHFLTVVESSTKNSYDVLYIDATSTSGSPPSVNLWPLKETDVIDGVISCATTRPPLSSSSSVTVPPTTMITFGTSKGSLGILSVSGGVVQSIVYPLPNMNMAADADDEGPPWKVTHLNWIDSVTLVVGLSRIILDPDCNYEDVDGEDDPHDHQVCFLIGTNNGSSSWTFSNLGDVVPFFSVPKGGQHMFHTAVLSLRSSPMLFVGCNVSNDVAVVCRKDDNWEVFDLMEGCQMSCPADDEDEFLYLMGLVVVLLPFEHQRAMSHPSPLLASSDGSLTGFVPRHRSAGVNFFICKLSVGSFTPDMAVPLAISTSEPPTAIAVASMSPNKTDTSDKCILSGLELGLDSVVYKDRKHVSRDDDDDDEISDEDSTSLDSAGSAESPRKSPNKASSSVSAFMSNISVPSFTAPSHFASPFSAKPTSIGFGQAGSPSRPAFGSAFGVTATTFGAAPESKVKSAIKTFEASSTSPQKSSLSSAPVFGSGVPVATFGSTATSSVGFGALAASSNTLKGSAFGAKVDDKGD